MRHANSHYVFKQKKTPPITCAMGGASGNRHCETSSPSCPFGQALFSLVYLAENKRQERDNPVSAYHKTRRAFFISICQPESLAPLLVSRYSPSL